MEFQQSEPHTFFVQGSTQLNGNPSVYSLGDTTHRDDSAKQLVAFTESERLPGGLTRIQVRYSQDHCNGDGEIVE